MNGSAGPAGEVELSAETADRLLYLASRAPSPHNAQGWRIEVDGSRFRVSLDLQHRVLAELDPYGRESELACGAAAMNLLAGAQALGFAAALRWRPERGVLAEVALAPGTGETDAARLAAIRDRTVNRSHYLPTPVNPAVLDALRAAAAADGFALSIATDPDRVAEIANVAAAAGRLKLSHQPTQRELYGLMRYSARMAAETRDGLDLELFFMPAPAARAASVAMHPRALQALRLAERVARDADEAPIRSAPAVCLLHAERLDADTFLRAGACFQTLALRLTEARLAHALHSAPIEIALSRPAAPHPSVPAAGRVEIGSLHDRLLTAFGVAPDAQPLALFRVGVPTRQPARRSLRRTPGAPVPADDTYRELTRRNQPAIPPADQDALRALRVLFAGCGSIGGAPVEPLVRMGVEQLVLAEPGYYEANNLNRQGAVLADVGRNKAVALADRARAINPRVRALVEPRGVTDDNVDWLVGTTDMIVDGVDVTEKAGIAAKRSLHEEAWRQRRLVVAGLDLGGTQLVYVFDYRDGRTRPFWGKLDRAGPDLDALSLLSRLIEPLDMPREMLAYTEATIRGNAGPAPQLAPTADQFGVLAAWAALDFACGRPLRRQVRVAIPNLLMTRPRRVRNEAARLASLARVKVLLEVRRVRQGL